jgi:hypothetical protein
MWPAATGRRQRREPSNETTNRGAINDRAGLGRRRRSGGRRYRPGSTRWSCAAGFLARLSGGQPIRPMSLVPRGSPGADRQSSYEPCGLGLECLPHLLVRLFRAGECRPEYFRGRGSTSAASTSAAWHQFPVPTLVHLI